MPNRLFHTVIHQMKDAVDKTFGVMDANNTIVACSELGRVGEQLDVSIIPIAEGYTDGGYTFKPIISSQGADYTVFVEGTDIICGKYASIIAVSLANIKNYYDEKYDRSNFIKDIILDNILPGDIYIKARELYFDSDVARTVIIIRNLDGGDVSVYEVLQNLFPEKNKDFVIKYENNTKAGVGRIVFTGKGNWKGTFTKEFTITKGNPKWMKDSKGWWYSYGDGNYPKNKWGKISGSWYHFDKNGYMQTGWLKDSGKWYYLKSSGVMATGWVKVGSKYYYMDKSGVMQANKWIGNYYVQSDGSMAVNKWIGKYHVDASGKWDKTK